MYIYFILIDISQNTNYLNTFVGFHQVHWAGSGAVCFGDGDAAEEHGPAQHLRYSGKFFQLLSQNPLQTAPY